MYVSEICAEGGFVTFPRWLKNVKSRSKITPFYSNERHFQIWIRKKQKKKGFSEVKLSKLQNKKTKNKQKKKQKKTKITKQNKTKQKKCTWQLQFP